MNLTDVIQHHADRDPRAPAVSTARADVSYGELLERARRTAGAFRELGVGPGDVVAVLLPNGLEFVDVMCAAAHSGAILLPLNWRLAPEELAYICRHAPAALVIASSELGGRLDALAVDGPVRHWLTTGRGHGRWRSLDALTTAAAPMAQPHPAALDDVHRLMYTSGTTDRPKGVPTTYGALYWKCTSHMVELELTRADHGLVCAPLFHVGALDVTLTNMLYAGGSTHILERFDPLAYLAALREREVTNVWLAPAMIATLLRSGTVGAQTFSRLRLLTHGGERISAETLDALEAAFPTAWIVDAYGLTETLSCDTFLPRKFVRRKRGSVGLPALHVFIRLVDDVGHLVPTGVEGEITIGGPKVARGYWRDPEATAAAFRDGWLYTGDVGQVDEDGFLWLVDRKKDVIRSGSENVASLEVERVVREHPAVDDVAVVGRPDPRWGEVPVAYVVLRGGAESEPDDLAAFARERLARFKVPAAFRVLAELPRNSAGKVLKQQLRLRERGIL